MATVAVVYPSGHNFDLDYYLSKHMPLVSKTWTPYGLKSWEIVKWDEGDYQIQGTLRWDSLESWKKCPKEELFGDVPNFTTSKPIVLVGGTAATFAA